MVCNGEKTEAYLQCMDFLVTGEPFQLVKCCTCGFVFLNPRPEASDLTRYYLSEDYHSHTSAGFSPIQLIYRLVRKMNIRHKFKIVNRAVWGNTILDIGCGTGDLLAHFKRHRWKTFGVEPNEKARNHANEKNRVEVKYTLDDWNFQPDTLDVITLWHVLEHIPDARALMIRLSHLLHDDGKLFIALPNIASEDARIYKKHWAAYDLPRHLHHFSPSTFRLFVENAGWKISGIIPMKFDAYYISLLSEKHQSGKSDFLRAIKNGLHSNRRGRRNDQNYSSLIYMLQKKTSPKG